MEAFIHSLESPPAILCLTETWLNENDDYDAMLISGYSQYVIKNRKTRGGGVMIQLQNGYNIINQMNSDFDEALFVDVINNGNLIKISSYIQSTKNKQIGVFEQTRFFPGRK